MDFIQVSANIIQPRDESIKGRENATNFHYLLQDYRSKTFQI
jgi:hypothetical protein